MLYDNTLLTPRVLDAYLLEEVIAEEDQTTSVSADINDKFPHLPFFALVQEVGNRIAELHLSGVTLGQERFDNKDSSTGEPALQEVAFNDAVCGIHVWLNIRRKFAGGQTGWWLWIRDRAANHSGEFPITWIKIFVGATHSINT